MPTIHYLSDFKLQKIVIVCSCGRRGEYDRDRAIERYGNIEIREFISMKAKVCRLRNENPDLNKCGAGCDDLMYMFQAAPFTDEWREKQ